MAADLTLSAPIVNYDSPVLQLVAIVDDPVSVDSIPILNLAEVSAGGGSVRPVTGYLYPRGQG